MDTAVMVENVAFVVNGHFCSSRDSVESVIS